MHTRRSLLASVLATTMLAACTTLPTMTERPPIVFVHGNGDSAALWQTTIWRFESNGWPRDRLFAIEQPYPLAREDDTVAQPGRSSTAESMAFLKSEVERVLKSTGADKVVLIGNSRGGNTIRNYVQNGGGNAVVSQVVLGGNPAHGIWAIPGVRERSEFSGLSPFIRELNAPKNAAGDEVTPGVKWLTVRSDSNDKYAQPDGLWIGSRGTPTNIGFDGPALKGATNVVLPGVDHRETSFSPAAFAADWQFLTGEAPRILEPLVEVPIKLSGNVTGMGLDPLNPASGSFANNLPIVGAGLSVFRVDPASGARLGDAVLTQTIGKDGRWGPFEGDPTASYEFVISAPGYATTHIYRSPFPRSSTLVNLRPERVAEADRDAKALVILTRPRGYFDVQRDTMQFDGRPMLPGVPSQGAGVSNAKLKLASDAPRAVTARFNQEGLVAQTWPLAQGHVSVLELTY
ncbi:MAG: twin-arginine translocation pathway signal [Gammaproteobacteria bacterium]|nr:twin-arginine translocation pathway signal [Gammaproteobacteria bacterium]MBU1444440.1 twin-arginine translocation pathway signal [Gammaproteobacteria bacterium]MBU2287512.1 twin-arginine translocation pathway signal [Gammaproteobacteria bacterium]MBU2409019.1 twin-arginine translocation pathway signal [Gammaproteobacteria bacterium]